MSFESTTFFVFFASFYCLYLVSLGTVRIQNFLILVASYVFYCWWDWRLGLILAGLTAISYLAGLVMGESSERSDPKRKTALLAVIIISLSALIGFQYLGFFAESFIKIAALLNFKISAPTLHILLPIGLSFYVFQTISYVIDVYRGEVQPARQILNYAVFIAFFPKLIAGPIERAAAFLPQLDKQRRITALDIDSAIFIILWGYFKKVFVADQLGFRIVDPVFLDPSNYTGLDYLVATIGYAFQLYCDFSAYSDIARGAARLMGFEITNNFRLPYFALNATDFWNRWHISLTNWIRDYMFYPISRYLLKLSGRKYRTLLRFVTFVFTMTVIGLWHGAAWTYVLWGTYHGLLLFLFSIFDKKPFYHDPWNGKHHPALILGRMFLMFTLVLFGWLLFRAESIHQVIYILSHFSLYLSPNTKDFVFWLVIITSPFLAVELWQYITCDLIAPVKLKWIPKAIFYAAIILTLMFFNMNQPPEFIYFQF